MCNFAGIEREAVQLRLIYVYAVDNGDKRCIVINDDATLSLMYHHQSWSRDLFISHLPIPNSGGTSRPNAGGESSSRLRGRRGYGPSDEDYIVPRVADYHVFSIMDGPDEITNRRMPTCPELYNGDPSTIKLGTHFSNKEELQGAVAIWSTRRGAEHRTTLSDKTRWAAECINRPNRRTNAPFNSTVCNWRIRALYKSEYRTWQITVWCDGHNCDGANNERDDRNISQNHVAYVITSKIRERPNYPIKSIIDDCEAVFGCRIGRKKALDGKRVALNRVYGDWETNFRQLPSYMRALEQCNDGTKVQWKFKKEDGVVNSRRKIFRYVFWHFGATKRTFEHSHPMVTVDAMHLKGAYKGKAIVALVKTANLRVVPVAYAVIDEESTHSWYWFLKYLKIYVLQDSFTCIISDRHSGILSATVKMDTKFPNWGVHRYCMEHVRANMIASVPKKKGLYGLCWAVSTALDQEQYTKAWTELIQTSPHAATYLQHIPLEKWTLFQDGFYRWGITTSNDAESYNNVLRGDRFLPIRALVQATHAKAMAIFTDEIAKINKLRYPLAERPYRTFQDNTMRARRYDVSLYPNCPDRTFRVWDTYRIPCSHAMAVGKALGVRRLDLVHSCHTWDGSSQRRTCPFSHSPADRLPVNMLYDPYGLQGNGPLGYEDFDYDEDYEEEEPYDSDEDDDDGYTDEDDDDDDDVDVDE
ncbi:uncharacterized protein [Rutidosis leptorrhynchoides]|uniref:uncharacterized protein n=1 Tax=Rutidosis leptorrhynchoides TaxID=125765 RepID=UPI003A98F17F